MVDTLEAGGSLPKGTRRLPKTKEAHPTGKSEPKKIDKKTTAAVGAITELRQNRPRYTDNRQMQRTRRQNGKRTA